MSDRTLATQAAEDYLHAVKRFITATRAHEAIHGPCVFRMTGRVVINRYPLTTNDDPITTALINLKNAAIELDDIVEQHVARLTDKEKHRILKEGK